MEDKNISKYKEIATLVIDSIYLYDDAKKAGNFSLSFKTAQNHIDNKLLDARDLLEYISKEYYNDWKEFRDNYPYINMVIDRGLNLSWLSYNYNMVIPNVAKEVVQVEQL